MNVENIDHEKNTRSERYQDMVGKLWSGISESEVIEDQKKRTTELLYGHEFGWVQWLLTREDAVTDVRLERRAGDNQAGYEEVNRPDGYVDPVFSGETASWTFNHREFYSNLWNDTRNKIENIFWGVNVDNIGEDKKEAIENKLRAIKEEIWDEVDTQLSTYAEELGIKPDNLIVAGSGADAIVAFYDLIFPPEVDENGKLRHVASITTNENGGGVVKGLDVGYSDDHVISLRNPNGSPRVDSEIANEYIEYIHKGARFVSLTASSKTELDYTNHDGVIDQVLAYVVEHNKVNPNKQVAVVVDVVQMVGRMPSKKPFSYLKRPGVSAIVHTGSKAPGGIPHAGFLVMTEQGKEQFGDSFKNLDANYKASVTERHELVIRSDQGGKRENNLVTAMRIADNANAVVESTQLWKEKGEAVIEKIGQLGFEYTSIFSDLGFNILQGNKDLNDAKGSIIAMHLPMNINITSFLDKLRLSGVTMGGPIQDENTDRPILRWGISWKLIKSLVDGSVDNDVIIEKLRQLKLIIEYALNESKIEQ